MICENGHYYSGSYCHICHEKPIKKPKTGINKVSLTNKVRLSDGSKILRSELNQRIHQAKETIQNYSEASGCLDFCWACGSSSKRLSWSHIISVDKCVKDGKAEFAYDTENLQNECVEKCHPETEIRKMDHHHNLIAKIKFIDKYTQSK